MAEVMIGKVTDYFAKIGVAALVINNGELKFILLGILLILNKK
jgi:hypothetical protein